MRRLPALVMFALATIATESAAQVTAYEWVTQAGPNNVIDSNATSCDNSATLQGCYNRIGGLCSADPSHTCDLQIVPKGRCTSGSLASNGGPGGTNTCVW